MSAPTRQFQTLSIDTQMSRRGQVQEHPSEDETSSEDTSSSTDGDRPIETSARPSTQTRSRSRASRSRGKQRAAAESSSSLIDASPSPTASRAYKIRDILSTFDANVLPENFRNDIFERIDLPRTPAQCLRAQDLEGTMFQLAVNDLAVYKSLSEAQPVQARAIEFFQKVLQHIRGTLATLDEHARTARLASSSSSPSARDVGDRLQRYSQIVADGVRERKPHGLEQAADCFFLLLEEVSERNHDILGESTKTRKTSGDEVDEDRNLYEYLIGGADPSGSLFVLDNLILIPQSVLTNPNKHHKLNDISHRLRQHRAPTGYRRALQHILDIVNEPASPTGAAPRAGQKRPAAGTGPSGEKRTR